LKRPLGNAKDGSALYLEDLVANDEPIPKEGA
jgi:predicted RNase H-like HicB family nuclease